MSSIVCFHAHPDDEALASGGTIAKLVDDGHLVTLVFATRGEVGKVEDGFLAPGVSLGEAREAEARKAAEILGVKNIEFLGFRDSGMENTVIIDSTSDAFCNADPDEAATRLVKILNKAEADTLTSYDPNGGYGHPDHIQVHQVGNLAAERADKTPRILWATMNRDHFMHIRETNDEVRKAMDGTFDDSDDSDDGDSSTDNNNGGLEQEMSADRTETNESNQTNEGKEGRSLTKDLEEEITFGWPDAEITHFIDVSDYIDQKADSIRVHASQITDDSFFAKLSPEARKLVLGTEWFVDPKIQTKGTRIGDILK